MHILFALILALGGSQSAADVVYRNGQIYTVDAARSWAETVAIKDGRFVFVGADRDVAPFIGPSTKVVDLGGKFVLPGFVDSHVHPASSGLDSLSCDLTNTNSVEEVFAAIKKYAETHRDVPWVRGSGWQLPYFPKANPTRQQLDALVPDRPAFFWAADGHSGWANTKALQLAGVTKATKDPASGRIERDESGEPSGTLREDAAHLVSQHMPEYSKDDYLQAGRYALKLANSFGLTTLYEAHANEKLLEAYAELDRRGELTARVVCAMGIDTDKGVADIPRLVALREKYTKGNVRATAVKIFADGVIEAHTAALLAPYSDTPGNAGKPNLEPAALNTIVAALDKEGFQVHIHAIGDGAIRMALDAYEFARKQNGPRDSRHHIAHLELIDPADIPRFRQFGVIANFQPLWAYRDTYIKDLTEPVLGPERSRWLYPIGSVMKTGAVVVFGSDWSVSSMNPVDGMQVAVTRRGLDAKDDEASWLPQELIGLPDAIAGYTAKGAYGVFLEHETGSIEVGKSADLVVLDDNLFSASPSRIHSLKASLVLLQGRPVHE